uniref:Preli-like n=1 Tax=Lepeophtheirus salmonis TaxID=72036 RepID=C1BVL4_LEPSM|nr:preli-like [Lepeophtheirus salmonis]
MAKYCETTHEHPFPWTHLAESLFRRYPNPFATHVLSEDTLYREVLPGGRLYSRRFLTKTNKLPKWGEKVLVNVRKYVPLIEESTIDPKTKQIITYTRNVGLNTFMYAVEKVKYIPKGSETCLAFREAWIESSFYGFRSAIENYGLKRFKQNCLKATEGFNYVLKMRANLREIGDRMKAGVAVNTNE